MSTDFVPRIKGRTAEIAEGEYKGEHVYEITFWTHTGDHQVGEPFFFGPYKTEAEAKVRGTEILKDIMDKLVGGDVKEVFDFKNGGVLRPWAEQ